MRHLCEVSCALLGALFVFSLLMAGCGGGSGDDTVPPEVVISGTVDASAIAASERQGPVFVAAARSGDLEEIENNPEAAVVDIRPVDAGNRYRMNLTTMGVAAGETIQIIGFIDNNFSDAPALDAGDFMGFYLADDSFDTAHTLRVGNNENLDIVITREVFDFDAAIGGTVYCEDPWLDCGGAHDLTIVAYAETISSLDFAGLDTDGVIGFATFNSASFPLDFTLSILPYGYDVPIENVLLFAFLDTNDNGDIDAGDILGSYALSADGMPACLTVFDGMKPSTDQFPVYMMQAINEAADAGVTVSGSVTLPNGGENTAETPVVVAVGDPDAMSGGNNVFAAFEYFRILPAGEYDFTLDLSATRFSPGDEVMVTALWDRDYTGCFPDVTPGDSVGFFTDSGSQTFSVVLSEGRNTGIDIDINREVFDFTAEIGGTINCNSDVYDCAGGHTLTIVAYAGEITSLDFADLDPDAIIAYKTITNATFPGNYTLSILPYGYDVPIENVHVFAFLDTDDDGVTDAGDILGSFGDLGSGVPRCITIADGMTPDTTDVPVYFIDELGESMQSDIHLSGRITLPAGGENSVDEPVVVAVGDPEALMGGGDAFAAVDYFQIIPAGDLDYALDLSATRFVPGDDVMVMALWDRDYGGCFPELTTGDAVGFYSDGVQSFTVTLAEGDNTGIDIDINREVYDFTAAIGGSVICDGGTVTCENGHDLTIVAYAAPLGSSDFTTLTSDGVIGYRAYADVTFPLDYTLSILPYGYDVPIEDVQLLAFLDTDDDGAVGPGDIVGYHATEAGGMPESLTITDGMTPAGTDFDIYMATTVPQPAGNDITISGSIEPPAGYDADSAPIFIIITDELDGSAEPALTDIRYFQQLDPGEIDFDIDLSVTALSPGDRVTVLALWDRNFNGFPVLTPVTDPVGIYMNTDAMQTAITLVAGENTVAPGQPDWGFALNRRYYEHNAVVSFQINCNGRCGTGDDLFFGAITRQGVNNGAGFQAGDNDIDADYIAGFDTATVQADGDFWYSLDILKILRYQAGITPTPASPEDPFSIDAVYLFAVADANGNGLPDVGEEAGFYWEWLVVPVRIPAAFSVDDTDNTLTGNRVLFWGETYE